MTVRALLINENIGGHATVHHHLRRIAADRADIAVEIIDVPPPGFWRKVAAVAVPGLGRFDADLRPVRYQLAQSVWVARTLRARLARGGVDVVHVYTHNAALLSTRLLRDVPYVITLDSTNAQSNHMHVARESTRFTGSNTTVVRPFERRVYQGARTVVANSEWVRGSLLHDYDVDPHRICVLPMGVPLPPPAAPAPTGSLPRVVFVGRGLRRKGGLDLLEAHRRWLSDRCELVMVTRDDVPPQPGVTVVRDAVPGNGKVDAVLAGADIFVFPSRLDQWPNAVMEAMSHGVPPIVSAVGGMPEMVLHGEAGVILPELGPAAVRDAVLGLLEDPVRRKELGARARRRIEEDLDVRITANALLDVMIAAALPSPGRRHG